MEKEIWKDVVGYEELYQVSNLGNVRSKERYVKYTKWKKDNQFQFRKSKTLSFAKMKNGYLRVQMSNNGIHKLNLVHRLVAQAFIPNPNNYKEVNHINCNKEDNRVENLEWVSSSYNKIHAIKNKLYKCEKPILQLKNNVIIKRWESASQVKKELGYCVQNIGKVALGKRKSAYGYQWKYI